VYLSDVAGFMVGTKFERQGIIRTGQMGCDSQARCRSSAYLRNECYGAGLYAMCGPASSPTPRWALRRARSPSWARSRRERVYYNKIMELPEMSAGLSEASATSTRRDLDIYKLASEMLVDDSSRLCLAPQADQRLAYAEIKAHEFPARRNPVLPFRGRPGLPGRSETCGGLGAMSGSPTSEFRSSINGIWCEIGLEEAVGHRRPES